MKRLLSTSNGKILMRAYVSRGSDLLIRLVGFSLPVFIILWLFQWDIVRVFHVVGFAFLCVGVPFLGVVGFAWGVVQLGKMFVDNGYDAAAQRHQRKSQSAEVWLDAPQTLNYDGRFLIGDDGELIELPETDEKHTYDNTTH